MMRTVVNFLKHSNVQLQLDVNPFRWLFVPRWIATPREVWIHDRYFGVSVSFLFVTIHVMLDDGSW